ISLKEYLLKNQLADAAELAGIEKDVARMVEEAHKFAENSPTPPKESATEHVFAEPKAGVRPSPAAAASAFLTPSDSGEARDKLNLAAVGDGRTPSKAERVITY